MGFLRGRERQAGITDALADTSVDAFEYASPGGNSVLIRLALRRPSAPPPAPPLLLRTAGVQLVLEPLPTAGYDGERWQIGYAAAAALVLRSDAEFTFALDGAELPLPKLVERRLAPPKPSPVRQVPASARTRRDEGLTPEEALALVPLLTRRCEISERAIAELRSPSGTAAKETEKVVKAWRECAELRELLDAREAEHRAAKGDAERFRKLEAELREAADTALAELSESREAAARECDRLQAELDARRKSEEASRAALDESQAREAELHAGVDAAQEREAALRADAQAAHDRFEAARASSAALEQTLAQATERAAHAEGEAAQHAREVGELTARLESAEGRAAEAQGLVEQHVARIAELETELEAASAGATRGEQAEGRAAQPEQHPAELQAARNELEAAGRAAEEQAARIAGLESELEAALERAEAGEKHAAAIAQLEEELEAARSQASEATNAEMSRLENELEAAKQTLADAEQRARELESRAEDADRLREKLEREARGGFFGARSRSEKAKMRAQAEENEKLRALDAERTEELDRLRVDRTEIGEELRKQYAIVADLRALLESERQNAEEARLSLRELRGRLAELPADSPAAPPAPKSDEAHPAWSAMDDELLARLERANASAANG